MTQVFTAPTHLEDWPVKAEPEDVCILRLAREYLSDPTNWTHGRYENPLKLGQVCSLGAVGLFATGEPHNVTHQTINWLYKAIGPGRSVVSFNDCSTHAEVLAMFDKAIGLAMTEMQ